MEKLSDRELFLKMKAGDETAFAGLFRQYYASLCLFSLNLTGSREQAEEVVQETFVRIWTKRRELDIQTSVRAYLLRAVRNRSLNLIGRRQSEQHYARLAARDTTEEPDAFSFFLEAELKERIARSIARLPEKRREIFVLSREEGLKYAEIADRLNISVKTVETQMVLALKQLRGMLKDYTG